MSKGKQLSAFEKGQIDILRRQGFNVSKISEIIGRSRCVCRNYMQNAEKYGQNNRNPRKSKLSPRTRKLICREASNKMTSAAKIKEDLGLDVTPQTVRNVLRQTKNFRYQKMKKRPTLTIANQKKRLDWAMQMISFGDKWKNVIFSDEKKFNLDGPDGIASYWHDLRKENLFFSKRQQGGGGVMIWAAFSYNGKATIAFCPRKMNSQNYQDVLEKHLLPFWLHPDQNNHYFQADNCTIHKSASTRNWLVDNAIDVLDWPACSPDFNPIENLFGIISRRVYQEGKHFGSEQELKKAILKEWESITPDILENLVNSIPKRIGQVILRRGRHADN